jgi:hypothetical protein
MLSNFESADQYLMNRGLRIGPPRYCQTNGGRHTIRGSHVSAHYFGNGRDYGYSDSDMSGIARKLEFIALMPNGPIAELFCSSANIFIKDGKRLSPVSKELLNSHLGHCHVALKSGRRLI